MSELLAAAAAEPYPERQEIRRSLADRLIGRAAFVSREARTRFGLDRDALPRAGSSVDAVEPHGEGEVGTLVPDDDLLVSLRRQGLDGEAASRVLARVAGASEAALGARAQEDDIAAARALLGGRLVEGPQVDAPLAVALAATVAALAGLRVHVLAVSPWCAARDQRRFAALHRAFGVEPGLVQSESTRDERRAAYASPLTYAWCRDVAFDYLRDRTVLGGRPTATLRVESLTGEARRLPQLLLRGLSFALTAHADAVFVDDAGMPAAIAGESTRSGEHRLASEAIDIAGALIEGLHFRRDEHGFTLSEAGRSHLGAAARRLGGVWHGAERRERLLRQALAALSLRRGPDYEVAQGRIEARREVLEAAAGDAGAADAMRVMLEVRESCEPARRGDTLVRIGLQRFYGRYLRIGGVAADAGGIAGELWSALGLARVRVGRRAAMPARAVDWRAFAGTADLHHELARLAMASLDDGIPLLVVMRDVDTANAFRQRLDAATIAHRWMPGSQGAQEHQTLAGIGAEAGIVVALMSAAAGTPLRCDSRRRLRVVIAQPLESLRQERRFVAPMADADAVETSCWLAVDDRHWRELLPKPLLASLAQRAADLGERRLLAIHRRAQRLGERRAAAQRHRLRISETFFADLLSFSGAQL